MCVCVAAKKFMADYLNTCGDVQGQVRWFGRREMRIGGSCTAFQPICDEEKNR